MIDPQSEKLIGLHNGKRLPFTPAYSTLRRWADEGCVSKLTGQRHFLETYQVGDRRYTTAEAVQRLMNKLNGVHHGKQSASPATT